MTVNSSYIANATDFFDMTVRFSTQTNYLFGHGVVALIGLVAMFATSRYGLGTAATYGGFFATLTAMFLAAGGLESWDTVIVCACFTLLVFIFARLSEN